MTISFLARHEQFDFHAASHWDAAPCESMLGVISEGFFFGLGQVVQETRQEKLMVPLPTFLGNCLA
jgi:hypothetical protein